SSAARPASHTIAAAATAARLRRLFLAAVAWFGPTGAAATAVAAAGAGAPYIGEAAGAGAESCRGWILVFLVTDAAGVALAINRDGAAFLDCQCASAFDVNAAGAALLLERLTQRKVSAAPDGYAVCFERRVPAGKQERLCHRHRTQLGCGLA